MPALEEATISDITSRLHIYLKSLGGYGEPEYLNAGGSAAIYKVDGTEGTRVFKVFNPSFFSGPGGEAERRRLEVQRHLIGHKCSSLVQTYRVEEAQSTAFIEMEFISWPQLTDKLADIPDNKVSLLIKQLVDAVHFLETQGIVHRDIKPDNIHISSDFQNLKLLDLGVAREFDIEESDDAAITDHGNNRPFLATAQYSSPEYLFRLDAPSVKLWKGLNFYQIGAVLHDLIMKKPIFQHEMGLGNRWLVARAVLTKTPSFFDGDPSRLASLKALSARCLVKDLDIRLQIVGWEDLVFDDGQEPFDILKGRLAKDSLQNVGSNAKTNADSRLEFDRVDFAKRFSNKVRDELIGAKVPLVMEPPAPSSPPVFKLKFAINDTAVADCCLHFKWGDELYSRSATIVLSARLVLGNVSEEMPPVATKAICTAVIGEADDEAIHNLRNELAVAITQGLDVIEAAGSDIKLHGMDLLSNQSGDK